MVINESSLPYIFNNVCKEIGLSLTGVRHDPNIEQLEELRRLKYPPWQEWGNINTRENMIDGVQRYLNQLIDIANDHEYQWNHHDYFTDIHVVSLDFWGDLGYIYPTFKLALEQVAGSEGLQESFSSALSVDDEPGTFEANLLDETQPTLSGTNNQLDTNEIQHAVNNMSYEDLDPEHDYSADVEFLLPYWSWDTIDRLSLNNYLLRIGDHLMTSNVVLRNELNNQLEQVANEENISRDSINDCLINYHLFVYGPTVVSAAHLLFIPSPTGTADDDSDDYSYDSDDSDDSDDYSDR